MKIKNPILRGFHPDPSIIRVDDDYYIATSTFEWWPGVRLHHSRDLVNWELIEYPLNRTGQLDLRGVGASQGVWAPCLTYDKGIFYLVYTVVKAFYCNMYDTNNYLVTAESIHGPWSDSIALNNFGFDPSLFHDEDGRKIYGKHGDGPPGAEEICGEVGAAGVRSGQEGNDRAGEGNLCGGHYIPGRPPYL